MKTHHIQIAVGRLVVAFSLFAAVLLSYGSALAQSVSPLLQACNDTLGDVESAIRRREILNVPWQYRSMADHIELETGAEVARLLPFGDKVTESGRRRVVIPKNFPRLACQLSLVTWLYEHRKIELTVPAQPAQAAASCLDSKPNDVSCLISFGDKLTYSADAAYVALSTRDRAVVLNYVAALVGQAAMHEYAHHFLGHHEHTGTTASVDPQHVDIVDAEFLADFFAMNSGALTGDPVNAMYYFFYPLAVVEQRTSARNFPDHETFRCRTSNVINLAMATGAVNILLVGAFTGGGTSPADVRLRAQELFSSPAFFGGPPECTHFKEDYAQAIRSELQELYRSVESHLEALFVADERLDGTILIPFISQLAVQAQKFRFLRELPALGAALLLQRFGSDHRKAPALTAARAWLNSPAALDGVSSGTYGRLLAFRGEEGLEDETGVPRGVRMTAGRVDLELAVYYNPQLVEAWSHLGFLDVVQGDCASAARRWHMAELWSPEGQRRDAFQRAARKLEVATPAECSKQPHVYPGL